jgi:hypothetical protein
MLLSSFNALLNLPYFHLAYVLQRTTSLARVRVGFGFVGMVSSACYAGWCTPLVESHMSASCVVASTS